MVGIKTLRSSFVGVVSLLAMIWCGQPAMASTTTATMPVAATVIATCVVAATPLVFGNYTSSTATATETTATITVNCTPGAAYEVGLDGGQNGNTTTRKMKGSAGTDMLNYGIFSNSGHTQNWGALGSADTVKGTGLGGTSQDQLLTVYGRIPAGAVTPVGVYTDVVTVTVSY